MYYVLCIILCRLHVHLQGSQAGHDRRLRLLLLPLHQEHHLRGGRRAERKSQRFPRGPLHGHVGEGHQQVIFYFYLFIYFLTRTLHICLPFIIFLVLRSTGPVQLSIQFLPSWTFSVLFGMFLLSNVFFICCNICIFFV